MKRKPKREPKTVQCPACHGGGRMEPFATGFESAWRINQWLMTQPCGLCKGKKRVTLDVAEEYKERKSREGRT